MGKDQKHLIIMRTKINKKFILGLFRREYERNRFKIKIKKRREWC